MLKEFKLNWKLNEKANKSVVQKIYVDNLVVEELLTTFLEALEKYGELYKRWWTNSDTHKISDELGLKEREMEKDFYYYNKVFNDYNSYFRDRYPFEDDLGDIDDQDACDSILSFIDAIMVDRIKLNDYIQDNEFTQPLLDSWKKEDCGEGVTLITTDEAEMKLEDREYGKYKVYSDNGWEKLFK